MMNKKIVYSIGIFLASVLLFINVTIVSSNLGTTTDLNMLRSQACEMFPEEWGVVALMHMDSCVPSNPNTLRYGCVDGGTYCRSW